MFEQVNDYEKWFVSAAARLAREDPIGLPTVLLKVQQSELGKRADKRAFKAAIKATGAYRQRGQFGRLRAALLLGATIFGTEFVKAIEHAGLLLPDENPDKFRRFLQHVARESASTANEAWAFLEKRLHTYIAYEELVRATASQQAVASRLLRTSPREILKKLLVLTHLRFLTYLEIPPPPAIGDWMGGFGTPEEFASITSLLLAAANAHSPLDSIDFALPLTTEIADKDVYSLMEHGRGLHQCYEISKDISLFGYDLEAVRPSDTPPVFYLRPPSQEFEYAMRLGFIRSEISRPKAYGDATAGLSDRPLSVLGAAEVFASRLRDTICELKDARTPLSRIITKFPLAPELYEPLVRGGLYEDLAELEELSLDFLVPLRRAGEGDIQLTKEISLQTFIKIWRLFRFLCLVDICAVRLFEDADAATVYNSSLRVAKEKDLVELISSLGARKEEASEFLRLVGADMQNLGHLDLQYRPFLKIAPRTVAQFTSPPEIVYVPALVGISNVLRNVQSANQLRLARNAELFVEATADVLRQHFHRVTINRRVKSRNEDTGVTENTDIDVAVLEEKRLYLFECKHSLPPTGSHEMRDLWEDVEKGTRQLSRAVSVLADPKRRHSYLTGWFPGLGQNETKDVHISTCVLCSHRIFSGMSHASIPIRDFSSLAKLVRDGFVGMGTTQNNELVLHRFRVTKQEKFSAADLDDYLSSDPTFFKLFKQFMSPVSRIVRCLGATVARETYVYEVDTIEWAKYSSSLGLVRLKDEHTRWVAPWTGTDLIERLKARSNRAKIAPD